ncbi:MAG: hypothetical protein ACKVG0_01410 [Alphaproteobacteria bacterium]|jgi:hypothetical protein
MPGPVKIMFATLLCIGLPACAPTADVPQEPPRAEPPPSEARYCPADGYLNCMPIVPAERRAFCSANYRVWIIDNCPNVEIVY